MFLSTRLSASSARSAFGYSCDMCQSALRYRLAVGCEKRLTSGHIGTFLEPV